MDKPEAGVPAVHPTQLQLNRRAVIRNIATLFSGSVVAQGMTALALLLTARQLGAAQYGQYASSFVLASFVSIVFSLGLDIWLLREGGQHPDRLGELTGSVLAIKSGIGIAWLGLVLGGAASIDSDTFPVQLVRLSALSVLLDSLFGTTLTAYKASLRNHLTSILEAGTDTAWLLATLALIQAGEQGAEAFIWARVIVQSAGLILSLAIVGSILRLNPSLKTVRGALQQTFPYAASEFLAWTSMRVDVLIVALTLGEFAVGLYSPAVGLANALFLVPAAVYNVIVPVLSQLFIQNEKQAWMTGKRSILLQLLSGSGLTLLLAVLAGPMIGLLGPSYARSQEILQILSPILLIHSLTFAMAAILVAANQQAKRTVIQLIAVASNAGLNLLIVHFLGIRGVAFVYVITEIILLAGYSWLVYRHYTKSMSPA